MTETLKQKHRRIMESILDKDGVYAEGGYTPTVSLPKALELLNAIDGVEIECQKYTEHWMTKMRKPEAGYFLFIGHRGCCEFHKEGGMSMSMGENIRISHYKYAKELVNLVLKKSNGTLESVDAAIDEVFGKEGAT